MKICFFTENYYKGGLDTFLINLINTWPDARDELTLVCNGSHPGLETIIQKTKRPLNIKKYYRLFSSSIARGHQDIKGFLYLPVRAFFGLAPQLLQYPILFPWYVFSLLIFFRRSDYERLMVVNGGYPASLLGRSAIIAWRLAGKRTLAVMNFHNSTTEPPLRYRFFENCIDAMVLRSSSRIISVSKNCIDSLNERFAFRACKKSLYIHNGIEDPVPLLKINLKKQPKYCLMLATYEARKGHGFLLQAFVEVVKDFPEIKLNIFGHGKLSEKKLVADEIVRLKLEDNVQLGDFTTKTAELIAGASVLVVPSQEYESFGLTIIEAMAFSVPVVTTDVGGMPEVLGNSNAGYVCSKDDPVEFSNAIKRILGDSFLASNLGLNGRLMFERKFMALNMTKQYSLIIKNEL